MKKSTVIMIAMTAVCWALMLGIVAHECLKGVPYTDSTITVEEGAHLKDFFAGAVADKIAETAFVKHNAFLFEVFICSHNRIGVYLDFCGKLPYRGYAPACGVAPGRYGIHDTVAQLEVYGFAAVKIHIVSGEWLLHPVHAALATPWRD